MIAPAGGVDSVARRTVTRGITAVGQRPPTLLVISQVYVPDPASVGQHMADAAVEMVRRGYRVVVYTADAGYDDPDVRYPRGEILGGVEVRRLPWCSFGKSSLATRVFGGASFVLQAVLRGLFHRVDGVLVSTSPPIASMAGLVLSLAHRAPMILWMMDVNPDQAVALGRVSPGALAVRALNILNRLALGRARRVVVLDRFMAARVLAKRDVREKLQILPPWPLEDVLEPVRHDQNPFRREHSLEGRFVVMYSGNHGPSNPFTTILQAALRLQDEPRLLFLFIGGGVGKAEVQATAARNVLSLPYQPLDRLRFSLSAADIHLVTVGNDVVGMVHPCKVYGAMAVGRPIILLGPPDCHVADILERWQVGWRVAHGDVEGAVRLFRDLLSRDADELAAMGNRARQVVQGDLSKTGLCGRLCDVVERGIGAETSSARPDRRATPA